jgi:hypothetical protein
MKVFLKVAVDVSAGGQPRDVERVKEAVQQGVFDALSSMPSGIALHAPS